MWDESWLDYLCKLYKLWSGKSCLDPQDRSPRFPGGPRPVQTRRSPRHPSRRAAISGPARCHDGTSRASREQPGASLNQSTARDDRRTARRSGRCRRFRRSPEQTPDQPPVEVVYENSRESADDGSHGACPEAFLKRGGTGVAAEASRGVPWHSTTLRPGFAPDSFKAIGQVNHRELASASGLNHETIRRYPRRRERPFGAIRRLGLRRVWDQRHWLLTGRGVMKNTEITPSALTAATARELCEALGSEARFLRVICR